VLELDPDLGADLDPDALRIAGTELVAPLVRVQWHTHRGRWGPAESERHLGFLITEGLLLRDVQLLSTHSAEVLGPGDLLRPWDVDGEHPLPVSTDVAWTVLAPLGLAILNADFLGRAARFPTVLARVSERGVGRAKALALHEAITNLKHVETRLLVLFWYLAERFGRVGPESIAVSVPLTHEHLARLVGAARPSVTTGLGRLAARGLLVRDQEGTWRLSPDSREALEPLPVQPETRLTGHPSP
jgi:CRP/FNR family transcriptional regulator, cyclic AMP receptor protein